MAPQVANVLASVGVEDLDGVSVHSRKEVASVGEGALLASLDSKLLVGSDVIDQQVHQPKLVRKTHQYVETTGVEGHAEALLWEELDELGSFIHVVPDSHCAIRGAGGNKGLSDASVHAVDALEMKGLRQYLELHLLRPQNVQIGQPQGKDLVVLCGARHSFLVRSDGEVEDLRVVVLDSEDLALLEDVLGVLALVVKHEGTPASSADESLRVGQDAFHSDLSGGLRLLILQADVRGFQEHSHLAILADDELSAVGCHNHPVLLGLVREPSEGQVVLGLPLGERRRQLLYSAVADSEGLEDAVTADADQGGVQGAKGRLVQRGALLRGRTNGRANLRLLPQPYHQSPVWCATLGCDVLAVRAKVDAHVFL